MQNKAITSLSFVLMVLIIGGVIAEYQGEKTVNVMAMERFEKPIYKVACEEKKIAVSFDAAWGANYTEEIMTILEQRNISTTFFLVGIWVEDYPEMVKKIGDSGHEIGNHSNTHQHMAQLSEQQIVEELQTCEKLIDKQSKDSRVKLFRPPFGEYDQQVLDVCSSLGYQTIQWTIDSLDWKETSAEGIINRVVPKLEPGAIILFHNNGEYTTKALPFILDAALDQGYEIVPISELTYDNNYTVDQLGIQRSN
jgi:polysaccharide deacetylase family sporulation protein PdaB